MERAFVRIYTVYIYNIYTIYTIYIYINIYIHKIFIYIYIYIYTTFVRCIFIRYILHVILKGSLKFCMKNINILI